MWVWDGAEGSGPHVFWHPDLSPQNTNATVPGCWQPSPFPPHTTCPAFKSLTKQPLWCCLIPGRNAVGQHWEDLCLAEATARVTL